MAASLNKGPEGVSGLARTTVGSTIATIVSVTLILLLIGGQPEDREPWKPSLQLSSRL